MSDNAEPVTIQDGQIAQTNIPSHLLEKVDSTTAAYIDETAKLQKLGIGLRPLWKRSYKIVEDSVDALDRTRAAAQMLLCEKLTVANVEKLQTLDKVARLHLQTLECALDVDLPSAITDIKAVAAKASAAAARSRSRSRSPQARGAQRRQRRNRKVRAQRPRRSADDSSDFDDECEESELSESQVAAQHVHGTQCRSNTRSPSKRRRDVVELEEESEGGEMDLLRRWKMSRALDREMRQASRPSCSWEQYRLFVEWAIRYMARAGETRLPNGHFCRGTYNTGGHTKEEVQTAFRDRYPDVPIPQSVFNNQVVPPLSKLWMVASSLNTDGQGSKYWWVQEDGSRGDKGDPRPEAMAARPPAPTAVGGDGGGGAAGGAVSAERPPPAGGGAAHMPGARGEDGSGGDPPTGGGAAGPLPAGHLLNGPGGGDGGEGAACDGKETQESASLVGGSVAGKRSAGELNASPSRRHRSNTTIGSIVAADGSGGDVVRRAGLRSGGNSSPDVFTFPRGGGGAAAAAPTDYRGGGGADSAESIVARAAASAESSPHRFPKLSIFWLTAVRTRFWEVTHAFVPGMRLLFSLNAAERRRGRTELLRASSRLEIRPMRASNARPTHATCEAQPKRITGDVVRCTFSRTWPKSAM